MDFILQRFIRFFKIPKEITETSQTQTVSEGLRIISEKNSLKTIRVWPQDNDINGFYIAKIKKSSK